MHDGSKPIEVKDISIYTEAYFIKPPCALRRRVELSNSIVIPSDVTPGVYELHLVNRCKHLHNVVIFSIAGHNLTLVDNLNKGSVDHSYKVCCE